MKKKAVSGLMLTLLLASMLTLTFNIQLVGGSETVYINADGSVSPPSAPISTVDNITYTLTGSITSDSDGIVVERDNIVVDGADYAVVGAGPVGTGISLFGNNVTLKNVVVTYFATGIKILGNSSTLTGNTAYSNSHGISVYGYNNTLTGNNASSNSHGIYVWGSNNTLTGNTADSNHDHGIINGELLTVTITNNTFTGNIAANNGDVGIYVYGSNNTLTGNTAYGNSHGISIYGYNNTLTGNTASFNGDSGGDSGIDVWGSNHTLAGNTASNNYYCGIFLYVSFFCNLTGNFVSWNGWSGIELELSDNNILTGNTVQNNLGGGAGIGLIGAKNNTFFHNNFKNFGAEVQFSPGLSNVWDDGYPSGGNYWSDYTGDDFYSGPYQNETGSDGIGDTPYNISLPDDQKDNYPLMHPSVPLFLDANFSGTPTSGSKPLTVHFTDLSTLAYAPSFVNWYWDFNNDSTVDSTEQNPTHTYTQEGNYTVTLRVTEWHNLAGLKEDTETKTDYIIVSLVNQPPVADANGPYTGIGGIPLTFNGSGSYDSDGTIVSYEWDFGDGNNGTGMNPTHTYAQGGTYTVILNVTDNGGKSNTTTTTATVVHAVDVAVTDIMLYNPAVYKGQFTPINVTVENQGGFTETFNVTAYYGWYVGLIGKQTVYNLPPGGSTTLTFIWNTTGVPYNSWAITVDATILPGETDATDNTYITGNVLVTIPGDVCGDPDDPDPSVPDGDVDVYDLNLLAENYGKTVV